MDWNCPVCGAATRRVFEVRMGVPIRDCGACGHRFAEWLPPANHVSEVYGDGYFFGGGAGYPDYLGEGKILRERGRKYARLIRKHGQAGNAAAGTMLDVGAAGGFICDGFRSEGWQTEALEPNTSMVGFGRDTLDLIVHNGTLEEFSSPHQFDLISMIQVIAHFANLRVALKRAAELTRERGLWLIETWDCRSLTARAFGRHWHEYSPPSVLNYFSRRSLELLALQFGFELVASGHPSKKIRWQHARSLLNHQVPWPWFERITKVVPDDVVLPYPSEDLVWSIFQKRGG